MQEKKMTIFTTEQVMRIVKFLLITVPVFMFSVFILVATSDVSFELAVWIVSLIFGGLLLLVWAVNYWFGKNDSTD